MMPTEVRRKFVNVPVPVRSNDRRFLIVAFAVMCVSIPSVARAQKERDDAIPKTAWPAAGLCRVWLKDVAPAQQPAPTDCGAALRNPPSSATVLFGDMPGIVGKQAPGGSLTLPPGVDGSSWSSRQSDDPMRRNRFQGKPAANPSPVAPVITPPPRANGSVAPVTQQPIRPADPAPVKP
jgi:hypothetical protein